MKILFLSRWFPYPADNGSKLRIYNLLRGLSRDHVLTLLSFVDPEEPAPDTSALRDVCMNVYTVPWRHYDPQSRRARAGFLSTKPRYLLDTYSTQMEREIRRLVTSNRYELVIASQLTMASYFESFKSIAAVLEEVELGAFYDLAFAEQDALRRLRNWLTWLKLKAYLSRILVFFDRCTVVSERERKIFAETLPQHLHRVVVIPNCIDVKQYGRSVSEKKPHQIVFSGSFRYIANYDAMLWFLDKVYPLVLEHVPDTRLLITGDHANLPLPMTRNVHCTGHVEDIKSLIASCEASIVPLRSGGGTRLKILEAMALGTPVVATTKGAEGLLAQPEENILIADEPDGFARQLIRLLQEKEFSRQLASNAFKLVKEKYDWTAVMPEFLQMIERDTIGTS